MKNYIRSIGFILFLSLIGYWWYYTYTYVRVIKMVHRNGILETDYTIAPKFTRLIITNDKDSSYVFYDEKRKSVVAIPMDEVKNLEFYKK